MHSSSCACYSFILSLYRTTQFCTLISVLNLCYIFILVDFDELKQDISSFRYEMLNYVSKNSGNDVLFDRISQMEVKINRLVEQQMLLLKCLPTRQMKLSCESTMFMTNQSENSHENGDDSGIDTTQDVCQYKKGNMKPLQLLQNIEEEHPNELTCTSPSPEQYDAVQNVTNRSPSRKRRDFQSENNDVNVVSTEDVEMKVITSQSELNEVVVEHNNLNQSLSGSTKDFQF